MIEEFTKVYTIFNPSVSPMKRVVLPGVNVLWKDELFMIVALIFVPKSMSKKSGNVSSHASIPAIPVS